MHAKDFIAERFVQKRTVGGGVECGFRFFAKTCNFVEYIGRRPHFRFFYGNGHGRGCGFAFAPFGIIGCGEDDDGSTFRNGSRPRKRPVVCGTSAENFFEHIPSAECGI